MNAPDAQLADSRFRHFVSPYGNHAASASTGPLVITRGEGVYVYDSSGRKYLEGVASLWYAALGFSEARLAEAAYRQMRELPCYHAFGNKVADVCLELTDKLLAIAPAGLEHVFYASSGSEANDTAIKLIRYYNNALGRPHKKKLIGRASGYHGTSLATAGLTGVVRNHWGFDLPAPDVLHTDCPYFYRDGREGETEESYADRLVASLEQLIVKEGADTIAAFFAEPVMGVGGVIVPPRSYFAKVQRLLREHDILFVVDEVITGFGRLGTMFGSEAFDLRPDMMTIAKGFSAGYAPISALLIRDSVFEVIAEASSKFGVLGHGYTYSAHPLPAAVALETLRIYEELDIVGTVRARMPGFWAALEPVRASPIVGELRGMGLMAGIELCQERGNKVRFPVEVGAAKILEAECLSRGLIVRAIGDTLSIAPPLIISDEEITILADRLHGALAATESRLLRHSA